MSVYDFKISDFKIPDKEFLNKVNILIKKFNVCVERSLSGGRLLITKYVDNRLKYNQIFELDFASDRIVFSLVSDKRFNNFYKFI
jgi:hypothetical protein